MSAYNAKTNSGFGGYTLPDTNNALNGVRRLFANLVAWSAERRAYRQAIFELNALSDRDLTDIGIARCDIPAVAREAAKANPAGR